MSASYSTQELIKELDRVSKVVGRPATRKDIKEYSTISPDTFERKIGRWKQANMFQALGLEHSSSWDISSISPEDGGWLAGFFCGEGYFGFRFLHTSRTTIMVKVAVTVRDDDRELLERVCKLWDLKEKVKIFSNEKRRLKGEHCGDEARLYIHSIDTIYYKIIPTFQRFQLYGKKGKEFEVFAKGIDLLHNKQETRGRKKVPYTQDEIIDFTNLFFELNEVRQHPLFRSSKANRL